MREKRNLKSNYLLSLLNLLLFLVLLCFLFEASRILIKGLGINKDFHPWVFFFGLGFPLIFYMFIADLNTVYENIQHFFFRESILNLLLPSMLLILTLGYFIFPKLFNTPFNKDVFTFLGAFSLTTHLIAVSKNTKGTSFTGFVNYLFIFSLLYLLTLIILSIYMTIGYDLHLGELIINSGKDGFALTKSIFTQLAP